MKSLQFSVPETLIGLLPPIFTERTARPTLHDKATAHAQSSCGFIEIPVSMAHM